MNEREEIIKYLKSKKINVDEIKCYPAASEYRFYFSINTTHEGILENIDEFSKIFDLDLYEHSMLDKDKYKYKDEDDGGLKISIRRFVTLDPGSKRLFRRVTEQNYKELKDAAQYLSKSPKKRNRIFREQFNKKYRPVFSLFGRCSKKDGDLTPEKVNEIARLHPGSATDRAWRETTEFKLTRT